MRSSLIISTMALLKETSAWAFNSDKKMARAQLFTDPSSDSSDVEANSRSSLLWYPANKGTLQIGTPLQNTDNAEYALFDLNQSFTSIIEPLYTDGADESTTLNAPDQSEDGITYTPNYCANENCYIEGHYYSDILCTSDDFNDT